MKKFKLGMLLAGALALFVSCGNEISGGKIDPNGKYGSLVIYSGDRVLDPSSITTAQVSVIGWNMTETSPVTVNLASGSGKTEITDIPAGSNRVVKVTGTSEGNPVTMYAVTDIISYSDGTKNNVTVNWANSREGCVWAGLISSAGSSFENYSRSNVQSALSTLRLNSVHPSIIDGNSVASFITGKKSSTATADYLKCGKVSVTANKESSTCSVQIMDSSSAAVTGVTTGSKIIENVAPGTWTVKVSNNGASVSYEVTVSNGGTANLSITVPGESVVSEKSAVMLQGFTWNSAPRGESWNKENPSPYWYKWYGVMKKNASAIKDTFDYVWFNPPSICDSSSSEGYAPTQLNDLNSFYGSATELKEVIQAIKPAKAIADIVVNHRAGTTCWGDFTNPDWGVVKGSKYPAICSDDEAFNSSSGDKAHMVGKPSGNKDTGASYGAYRDLDHTNTTVQQGIIDWMNNVLKPAGFVGWRYDYVKGFGASYVGQYNKGSSAEFSVGEYWPTAGYSSGSPDSWGNEIKGWISGTATGGQRSRAFDFALKGAMNDVFGCTWNGGGSSASRNFGLLAHSSNLYISQPSDAVTFVDNHDTGSNQGHWALRNENIGVAYALILTHPGVPCVAWSHYFTFNEGGNGNTTYPYSGISASGTYIGGNTVSGTSNTLRQHIDTLIKLRKDMGIEYDSERKTLKADNSGYAAEITGENGSVITLIGSGYTPSDSEYELAYSGTDFKIWTKGGSGVKKCKSPVISISDGKATIACGTSGAVIKYGFSGSSVTNTYTGAVTMSEGQTIYAKASAAGMEDSSVVSKTYTVVTSTTYKATSSATWITNAGCVVFAWCWGGEAGEGCWYAGKSDSSGGFTWEAPGDITNFLLARCIAGTTEPDWEMKSDSPGRVYNQTDDYKVTSGVTQYSVQWN